MIDIDEFYENATEKEKEDFLKALQENKKLKDAEKKFKLSSKETRKKYEKEYEKKLKKESINEIKKIKEKSKPKKKINTKEYHVEPLDLELNWKEKAKIKGAHKTYKIKRKVIDFYEDHYPEKIIYAKYKVRNDSRRNWSGLKEFINSKHKKIVKEITGFLKFLKKFFKRSRKVVKKEKKKLLNLFKKKKEKGKDKPKKPLTEKEKREQQIKEIENKIANGSNKKEDSK